MADVLGVPIGRIRTWRNIRGTWRHFGNLHGIKNCTHEQFDALEVPDEDIAAYILRREEIKERDSLLKTADAMPRRYEELLEERDERIVRITEEREAKLQEYLEDFAAPTQADVDNLRLLAGTILAAEYTQRAQMAWMDGTDQASIQTKAILSRESTDLTREVRQLIKDMGLDMPTRARKTETEDAVAYIRRMVEGASEFIDEHVVEVEHCGILLRQDADFFPELYTKLSKQCPRCGEMVEVEYGELKEIRGKDSDL